MRFDFHAIHKDDSRLHRAVKLQRDAPTGPRGINRNLAPVPASAPEVVSIDRWRLDFQTVRQTNGLPLSIAGDFETLVLRRRQIERFRACEELPVLRHAGSISVLTGKISKARETNRRMKVNDQRVRLAWCLARPLGMPFRLRIAVNCVYGQIA